MQKQNLIQKVLNRKRFIIYYDQDLFNSNINISINLSLTKNGEIIYRDTEELEPVEWNTIHAENVGTNGNGDNVYESLDDIAVHIKALPPEIQILGYTHIEPHKDYTFKIPEEFRNQGYQFSWQAEDRLEIVSGANSPDVVIRGTRNGAGRLQLKVYHELCETCCSREMKFQVQVNHEKGTYVLLRNRFH